MTVSAAEDFTSVTESGSDLSWVSEANIQYGGTGYTTSGTTTNYQGDTDSLVCSVPYFMTALPNGSEFISLAVSLWAYPTGPWDYYAKLTGGTELTAELTDGITVFDGNAAYWGLSGSASQIFSGLKSGTIKFEVRFNAPSDPGYYVEVYGITAQLTYRLADTKRAALVQCVA